MIKINDEVWADWVRSIQYTGGIPSVTDQWSRLALDAIRTPTSSYGIGYGVDWIIGHVKT